MHKRLTRLVEGALSPPRYRELNTPQDFGGREFGLFQERSDDRRREVCDDRRAARAPTSGTVVTPDEQPEGIFEGSRRGPKQTTYGAEHYV